MNKRTIGAFAAALGLVGVLMLGGCSDDDDKGTNTQGDLTAEEQYAVLNDLLLDNPGTLDGGLLTLLAGFIEANYWDGIDSSDFAGGASLSSHRAGVADIDSLTFAYNVLSGWWHIYFERSGVVNDVSISEVRRDSVRFETATGQAQAVPDENTQRIRGGADFSRIANGSTETSSFDLELNLAGVYDIVATGVGIVTINGDADGTCTLGGTFPDTTLTLYVETSTSIDDVVIGGDEGECPSSGEVAADLGVVLDVTVGEEALHSEGSWQILLTFLGECMAGVDYRSGDTHITAEIDLE